MLLYILKSPAVTIETIQVRFCTDITQLWFIMGRRHDKNVTLPEPSDSRSLFSVFSFACIHITMSQIKFYFSCPYRQISFVLGCHVQFCFLVCQVVACFYLFFSRSIVAAIFFQVGLIIAVYSPMLSEVLKCSGTFRSYRTAQEA